MSLHKPWERALERYADALYRFALLRDLVPAQAAQATFQAFEHFDWSTLDDQIEARLVAALPPLKRGIGRRLPLSRREPFLLPAQLRQLAPTTRLALGMRLMRGHSTASIALALRQPIEDVRTLLCDAIARIAGDDPTALDAACRHSRSMRLDEPGLERMHTLNCAACRADLPRWEVAEHTLSDTLMRTVGAQTLPRETVEAIAQRVRAMTTPAAPSLRNTLAPRIAGVVLVVLIAIGLLIVPDRNEQTAASVNVTARDVLGNALSQYGAVPSGEGVVHQRIQLMLSRSSYQADVWTDTTTPGRHRMQLMTGTTVQEWQGGDGVRSWRYFTQPDSRFCGLAGIDFSTTTGRIGRWSLESNDQDDLRAARWQSGPWAIGRQLLEQALAAPNVRSLGTVNEDSTKILTVAAEGGLINGTLLLQLDAANGALREIRQITVNNGQTLAESRWKLLREERLATDEAMRSAVFTTFPAKQEPRAIERATPILDPACPIGGQENTANIASILGVGWPPLIGFSALPTDLEIVYAATPAQLRQNEGIRYYQPQSTALVYVGPGKRLVVRPEPIVLQPGSIDRPVSDSGIVTGGWHVTVDTGEVQRFNGTIMAAETPASVPPALRQVRLRWTFFAEGWQREELLTLLGTLKTLRLQDWLDHQVQYFDPEPIDPEVLQITQAAMQQVEPTPNRIDHLVVERELRQEPGTTKLDDPYHALGVDVRTDSWIRYGADSQWQSYRSEASQLNGQPLGFEWGDKQHIQSYDARANVVRNASTLPSLTSSSLFMQHVLGPIFQYGTFKVTARDDVTATVAASMPSEVTEYSWTSSYYQPPISYWQNWASLAGTIPQSVTLSFTFDTQSDQLREYMVTIPGPNGPILIDRTTVVTADIGAEPPAAGWQYQPPADAPRISVDEAQYDYPATSQQRIALTALEGAVQAAPAPLWSWPEGHSLHFTDAYVPTVVRYAPQSFEQIGQAVTGGYAVELHFDLKGDDTLSLISLIEGSPAQMRLLLQQTPAAWTESEQRTITIAGSPRDVWIMRSEEQHWAIFQLETTFIVLTYNDIRIEDMMLSALADLTQVRQSDQ